MLETIITIGVMLISIITPASQRPINTQSPNQNTLLAAIDIVSNPSKKISKDEKNTHVNVANDTLKKKKPTIKPTSKKQKFEVSGYQNKNFVYGEVKPLKGDKVQGFIYRSDNSQTYVYGKKNNDTLNLYDTDGNLYQMKYNKTKGH